MAKATIRLTSPRGRLVQGDAFEAQTTDQNGVPLTIKQGPNAGQPTKKWYMGVAFKKGLPEVEAYIRQIGAFAAQVWPAYFPSGATGQPPLFGCIRPNFSIKIVDGDGVDDNGKQNRDKPGFAGHWVVKYSTNLQAPGVWQEPNFDEMARVTDPRQLPTGYFVKINHTLQSNENDQRSGLYVNLDKVAICQDQNGAEIIQSGPSAAEAFGGPVITTSYTVNPPAPPAPPAAAGGLVPNPGVDLAQYRAAGWTDDQLVQNGLATRSAPLPVAPPPAPPAATPAAPPPPAPPATPSPSSPPPPPYSGFTRVMLPAANGQTYDAMIASGWTDALLIQHGMMTA